MTPRWLDTKAYPFHSKYFKVNAHRMHYIDEGKGAPVLFVHGTPSWSFDFRNVIRKVNPEYRCIAMDHIGFGLSDKPKHYDYTTQNHSRTLEQFIIEKQLDNITIVAHDFGGPIALHAAIKHPDKIKRLVILNSWLWSSREAPEFIKLSKLLKSPLLPFLYRYFNFSPKYILPKSFGAHKLPKHFIKQYTHPFAAPSQRNGTVAFAKSLLNDQEWFQELWKKKGAIANKPALFIWGMKDPVVPPRYLEKFISGFSNSKAIRLETCGHFPQEEQPEIVADCILKFLEQ